MYPTGWFFEVTGSFTATFIMFTVMQLMAVLVMLVDIAIVERGSNPTSD